MKKISFLVLLIIGFLFPIGAEAKNALNLDENKSVYNGEEAKFALSIDLDAIYDNKIEKITFDLNITGGSIGTPAYIKTTNTNLWKIEVVDNVKYTMSTDTSAIVKGDHLLDLIIPIKEDCPEGTITVSISDVKFYHEIEDPSSSQSTIITPIVASVDGSARLITVTRVMLSATAALESLTLSLGELSPEFNQTTYAYDVVVKDTINKITIEAKCQDKCSSLNGNTNYTFKKSYTLVKGENEPIEIKVISQNGLNAEKYVINIFRGELIEERGDLRTLTIENVILDPPFDPKTYNYYVNIPFDMDSLVLDYVLYDLKSTVTVTGNENLEAGKENKITITVLSVDEKIEHSYNIYATKAEDTSSSEVIIDEPSNSNTEAKNESKLIFIILIIIIALAIIGASFFFIFKNKKNGSKKKKGKNDSEPEVSISHDDDVELLEYTKEYTDLVKKIDEKKDKVTIVDDDYGKL